MTGGSDPLHLSFHWGGPLEDAGRLQDGRERTDAGPERRPGPAHAQDIYKEAFNSAWDEYKHDEERAHRVAWGAVKKSYHKSEKTDKWVKGAS